MCACVVVCVCVVVVKIYSYVATVGYKHGNAQYNVYNSVYVYTVFVSTPFSYIYINNWFKPHVTANLLATSNICRFPSTLILLFDFDFMRLTVVSSGQTAFSPY